MMYAKVYVEITNKCNMACSFCHGHSRKKRQLTAEEFARILEQLTGKTEYIYYHLMGEPLLHPELPRFLQMAADKGFRSVITTNGTLLSQRAEDLLRAKLHKVNISLHSFEQGSEADHLRYVGELAAFAQRAAAQGTISVFRLWNRGHDDGKNDIAYDFLRKTIPGEWVKNTHGIRIRDKIHIEWGERFAWPDLGAEIQGEKFSCYGLRDHFGILADGTVVPCCLDSDGVIALGNIFEEDIGGILRSPRAENMVEAFSRGRACEALCQRCGYAQRFVSH